MPANTIATPYTGPEGAIMQKQEQLTADYASKIRGAPAQQQQMGEEVLKQDPLLGQYGGQREALIQKLFEADQQIEQNFGRAGTPDYVEDPRTREGMVQDQQAGVYGALGNLNTLIGGRKDVLGDLLEKGIRAQEAENRATEIEWEGGFKLMDLLGKLEGGGAELLTPAELKLFPGATYGMTQADIQGRVPLSPKQQELLGIQNVLENQFATLEKLSAGKAKGDWGAKVARKAIKMGGRNLSQELRDIQEFEDFKESILTTISRRILAETGTINDRDVDRARQALPDIGDDSRVFGNKMATLRGSVDIGWESVVPGMSKIDVMALAEPLQSSTQNYADVLLPQEQSPSGQTAVVGPQQDVNTLLGGSNTYTRPPVQEEETNPWGGR